MTYKHKKVEPAISQHFSKLAKKSWAIRKQKILEQVKPLKVDKL